MFEPPCNHEPLAAPVAGPDADQAARLARLQQRRSTVGAPEDARQAPPPGRRHPARQSRAVAFASSVTASVGLAAYFASTSGATAVAAPVPASATMAPAIPTTQPTVAQRVVTPAPVATVATVPTPTATAVRTTTSATTTTFTGTVAQMRYGPVQVAITVAGGKITDVSVPVTPTDRKSTNINNRAVPVLDNQAIASQSARVDTVSGATYTSDAYRTSLQSAINAAHAAGKL